jgi:hypothetical protein
MNNVVVHQPAIAYAVHCLTLFDQLELTLQLLEQDDWPDFHSPEPLALNVVPFSPVPSVARRRVGSPLNVVDFEQHPVPDEIRLERESNLLSDGRQRLGRT